MSEEIVQQLNMGDSDPSSPPPPAYFLSLTVENFRCFGPSQTLDLSDGNGHPAPWTVILGDNGIGKTTLLQCLAVLKSEANPFAFSGKDNLTSYYLPLLSGVGKLIEFGSSRFENAGLSTLAKIDSEVWYGKLVDASLVDASQSYYFHGFKLTKQDGSMRLTGVNKDLRGLICYGYGATRRMGNSSLVEKPNDDACESLFSDNVDLLNAEEWLLQADYAASKPSKIQEQAKGRLDQIKRVLIELLPDVTDIRITEPENVTKSPSVQFQTPYGWVGIRNLSLGYRAMIAWMVDFTRRLFDRYPNSPNPLAEPAIALVDEIDLHLHPRWQRKLREFLTTTFPNTQFIVTAHSPLVVQAASDANIVLLKQEGDHVIIDNDVKTIQGWRVDQVLTSDLFGLKSARPPQIDALLKERTEILSKPNLTKADEARLVVVEAQIGDLPTGETPEDIDAMDIIRRAAELLKTP